MEHHFDLFSEYGLDAENYKGWRKVHTKMFGELFSAAFEENAEAAIHLTAALIKISQRNFEAALPVLNLLESVCNNEYDLAVVNYFIGLTYEMLEKESPMTEYYEKVRASEVLLVFPLTMHPYYRTAKFAQRDSECSKAVFYYRKALSLYEGVEPDKRIAASIGQILYDVATVKLFMHEYDECERFLELSTQYDGAEHQHRLYVTAILESIREKTEEVQKLLGKMNAFLRMNCEPMVNAILAKSDPHYGIVPQDRSEYSAFWDELVLEKNLLEELVGCGRVSDAEKIISEKLSKALPFMQKQLACRIVAEEDYIAVFCKNYHVKTLVAEYNALFEAKQNTLPTWSFVSVAQFESYEG